MNNWETTCFVVKGKFLTDHARALWAECAPNKAISLLMHGLQGIELGQVMDVLMGKTKLVGDSFTGVNIVKDDVTKSYHGLPLLSLTDMFEGMQKRAEIAERGLADLIAIENGNTMSMSSPSGLRMVSRTTAEDLKKGEVTWEDVQIFRDLGQAGQERLPDGPEPYGPEPKSDPPPPLLKPQRVITTNTGWLSPDGEFYPCEYQEHVSMATRIQQERHPDEKEPALGGWERSLEKRGWFKLAGHEGVIGEDQEMTERQNTMILKWCLGEGKDLTPMPYWMKPY